MPYRRTRTNQYSRPFPSRGFNSHGHWSTLGSVREEELDRGNEFPVLRYPDSTPTIWVCLSKRKALRYLAPADDWDRLSDETTKLTRKDREMMHDVSTIKILPTDIVAHTDPDEGYLILRPKRKVSSQ